MSKEDQPASRSELSAELVEDARVIDEVHPEWDGVMSDRLRRVAAIRAERLPEEGQEILLHGVPEHLRYQQYARPDWIGPGKAYRDATHWLAIEQRPDERPK